MVSVYNQMTIYQKNHPNNMSYAPPHSWYTTNYQHHPANAQYLAAGNANSHGEMEMYYNGHHPHPAMFHQASPDWTTHDSYGPPTQSPSAMTPTGSTAQSTPHHGHGNGHALMDGQMEHTMGDDGIGHAPPSPPITVNSGCSDMSSPGIGTGGNGMNGSDDTNAQISAMTARQTNAKSPYEWMKKAAGHPQPGMVDETCISKFMYKCENIDLRIVTWLA